MTELNKLAKEIMGKKMTKKQECFLQFLRAKVQAGELTVAEAKELWNEKYHVWKVSA